MSIDRSDEVRELYALETPMAPSCSTASTTTSRVSSSTRAGMSAARTPCGSRTHG
jgi:hypothetical protein